MALKNIFKKKALAFLVLITLLASSVIISLSFNQIASAVTGNYNKSVGSQLTLSDWNTLDTDFLDKENTSGDSMAGPLTLPGDPTNAMHAATKQYVDNLASVITFATDRNGNAYSNVVCDSYLPNWTDYDPGGNHRGVTATIDTRSSAGVANFSSIPRYYVSIEGIDLHYDTQGVLAVYSPSMNGFTIYLKTSYYENDANFNQWRINWCGFGN